MNCQSFGVEPGAAISFKNSNLLLNHLQQQQQQQHHQNGHQQQQQLNDIFLQQYHLLSSQLANNQMISQPFSNLSLPINNLELNLTKFNNNQNHFLNTISRNSYSSKTKSLLQRSNTQSNIANYLQSFLSNSNQLAGSLVELPSTKFLVSDKNNNNICNESIKKIKGILSFYIFLISFFFSIFNLFQLKIDYRNVSITLNLSRSVPQLMK
jgi:hypothetical protein